MKRIFLPILIYSMFLYGCNGSQESKRIIQDNSSGIKNEMPKANIDSEIKNNHYDTSYSRFGKSLFNVAKKFAGIAAIFGGVTKVDSYHSGKLDIGILQMASQERLCNNFSSAAGAVLASHGPFAGYYENAYSEFYDSDSDYDYAFKCNDLNLALIALNEQENPNSIDSTLYGNDDIHLLYYNLRCQEILAKFAIGTYGKDIVSSVVPLSTPDEYTLAPTPAPTASPVISPERRRLLSDYDYYYDNFKQGVCWTNINKTHGEHGDYYKENAMISIVSPYLKYNTDHYYNSYYTYGLKTKCNTLFFGNVGNDTCNQAIPFYPNTTFGLGEYYYATPTMIFTGNFNHTTGSKYSAYLTNYNPDTCYPDCTAIIKFKDESITILKTEITLDGYQRIVMGISYDNHGRTDAGFLIFDIWCNKLDFAQYKNFPVINHLTTIENDLNNPPIYFPQNVTYPPANIYDQSVPKFPRIEIEDSLKGIVHGIAVDSKKSHSFVLNLTNNAYTSEGYYGYGYDNYGNINISCMEYITEVSREPDPTYLHSNRILYNIFENLFEEIIGGNTTYEFVQSMSGTTKDGGGFILFSEYGECSPRANLGTVIQKNATANWRGNFTLQAPADIINDTNGTLHVYEPGYITLFASYNKDYGKHESAMSIPLSFGVYNLSTPELIYQPTIKGSSRAWTKGCTGCDEWGRFRGVDSCPEDVDKCTRKASWWTDKKDSDTDSDYDYDEDCSEIWVTKKDYWGKQVEIWAKDSDIDDCIVCGPTPKPTAQPTTWQKTGWASTTSYKRGLQDTDTNVDTDRDSNGWKKTTTWAPTPRPTSWSKCPIGDPDIEEECPDVDGAKKDDDEGWIYGLVFGIIGAVLICCCILWCLNRLFRHDDYFRKLSITEEEYKKTIPGRTSATTVNV